VFLDGDDFFTNNDSLKNLYAVIQQIKLPVVFNCVLTSVSSGEKDVKVFNKVPKDVVKIKSEAFGGKFRGALFCTPWAISVERSFLLRNKILFKEGIIHEDELFVPLVICACKEVAVNNNPFYTYRTKREGSIMYNTTVKHIYDRFTVIEELLLKKDADVHGGGGGDLYCFDVTIFT
jgi:hypothetical protein